MSDKIDPKSRGTFVEEFLEGFDHSELARKVGASIVETLEKEHADGKLIRIRPRFEQLFAEHPDIPDNLRDDLPFFRETLDAVTKKLDREIVRGL